MAEASSNLAERAHLMMVIDELDSVVRELTNGRVRVIILDEFREEDVELTINLEGRTFEDFKYVIPFARVGSSPSNTVEEIRKQFLELAKSPESVFVRALEWFTRE